MNTRSAFMPPIYQWLITAPELTKQTFGFDEFTEEVGRFPLPSGLIISVWRGGIFEFDFAAVPVALVSSGTTAEANFQTTLDAMAQRVLIVNSFALCLHSGVAEVENFAFDAYRVPHRDLIHLSGPGPGMSGRRVGELGIIPGVGYAIPFGRHGALSEDSIRRASELLEQVLVNPHTKSLELTGLLNEALAMHTDHDFSQALTTAWNICETLIRTLWTDYYNNAPGERPNSERRRFLNGSNFTASVITEILSLAGALPSGYRDRLGAIRKKRNDWMHSSSRVGYANSAEAIGVAVDMLHLVTSLKFRLNPTTGVSGIG